MLTLEEVRSAIAFDQPKLHASADGQSINVEGTYLVFEKDVVSAPDGPIAEFYIKIELTDHYPRFEPRVFEVGGRIPRNPDRHINPDGDCCVTVWENWLVMVKDHSFSNFLNGPLNEYFLGQFWFEKTGKWPFGERGAWDAGSRRGLRGCAGNSKPAKKPALSPAVALPGLAQRSLAMPVRKWKASAVLPPRRPDGHAPACSVSCCATNVAPVEAGQA
ncbi:hypothetical protein HGG72_14430 [Ochrobactrum pecoris]|nr:hypothetical protein [Brucella pecoris]